MSRPNASVDIVLDQESPRAVASAEAYGSDFYAWTLAQVAALRRDNLAGLDIPNLIEEIDSLGRAQINALRSRYFQLCTHLLKLTKQPQRASRSWHGTISHQRIEIARLLKDSPSLKTKRAALFEEGYEDARRQAAVETDFNIDVFPKAPPFTIDQAEAEGWLP